MTVTDNNILTMLGWNSTGDVGPWTLYTAKDHGLVFYARVPALNPASPGQKYMRTQWELAAAAWQALSKAQRTAYESASKKLSLRITGYNLYLYQRTTGDRATIRTIERQTGLTLAA
jgi:hypothetical protein